jgi:hypothetical protein
MAIDSSYVYLGRELFGQILSVTNDGSVPPVVIAGSVNAAAIVSDGTSVYWVEPGSGTGAVRKTPIGGGTVTTLATMLTEPAVPQLAVDATSVYVAEGFTIKSITPK